MENLNTEVKNAFIEFHSRYNQHIVQAIERHPHVQLAINIEQKLIPIASAYTNTNTNINKSK